MFSCWDRLACGGISGYTGPRMMYPYMVGSASSGASLFSVIWLFWGLIWTVNSILFGMVLWALVRYLQGKTK